MRRSTLIGSPLLRAAPPVRARGVIALVTADQLPYGIAEGPEPGFVLTLAAKLFRLIGLREAFAALQADGSLDHLLRPNLGPAA